MGCPDCRGVLAVREEGKKGHLAFVCLVGHMFSGESLVRAKEEEVENAVWSAVELYEEIVLLHQELSVRARAADSRRIAAAFQQRARLARGLVAELRGLIGRDAPAAANGTKG